jgi:hypothetical protein
MSPRVKGKGNPLIAKLEKEARTLDSTINDLRFLDSLKGASGGDITVKLKNLLVTVESHEINDFKKFLTRILEARI